MTNELADTINAHLPNRGYTMHGRPVVTDRVVRTDPPSLRIDGGALETPDGELHESWSATLEPRGLVVFTDEGHHTFDTSKWVVRGETVEMSSLQFARAPG